MSFNRMLAHRCDVLEMTPSFVGGVPTSDWAVIAADVSCFLDLNFIRRGKDPMWTPETGRPADRNGVLFVKNPIIKSGHRIRMKFGPEGTFLVEGAVDQAWRPKSMHHVELGVVEVPKQISKGKGDK